MGSQPAAFGWREANRALRHLDVSGRREHGLQGGPSPMAGTSADWWLRIAARRRRVRSGRGEIVQIALGESRIDGLRRKNTIADLEQRRPFTPPAERSQFRLADHAVGNCWRVPPGHVGRHKGAALLHSGVGDPLKATVEVLAGLPRKQD